VSPEGCSKVSQDIILYFRSVFVIKVWGENPARTHERRTHERRRLDSFIQT
jgi:hypothetical protein